MSEKVVPESGTIYLKTAASAASNSIFQVFGTPVGNNLVGLVGSNYNTSTRPPPFIATNTIPTAGSGNLKMSFFAGKSKFLTPPSTIVVSNITTTTLTPTLSGGNGTSYHIAIGSATGTSNILSWREATTATQITGLSFTPGTSYYISAYSSNATNSTSSLAVSNTAEYGIPNEPATVRLTITSLTSWSVSWTAAASGIGYSGYSWSISTSPTVPNTATNYFGTTTGTTASGTAALTAGIPYYATVRSTRTESISIIKSAGLPTGGTITYGGGGKIIHTFTVADAASRTPKSVSAGTFVIPSGYTPASGEFSVLVVGGGGAGGSASGGGGGAGGVWKGSGTLFEGTYSISIGVGGSGSSGGNTVILFPYSTVLTAYGGGSGGEYFSSGTIGGSGGGAGSMPFGGVLNGGSGTIGINGTDFPFIGYGNSGGGNNGNSQTAAGGGAGGLGESTNQQSKGGLGILFDGSYYAGGGGGTAGTDPSTRGLGGSGVGGNSGTSTSGQTPGAANTGSGGGAGGGFGNGANGTVIIFYNS